MYKSFKTKLNLNKEQRSALHACAGVSRFAYNLTLEIQKKNREGDGKFIQYGEILKSITLRKKDLEDLNWLYKYSCSIVTRSVKDACEAYKRFFKKISGFPRFKSRKTAKQSFYVEKIKVAQDSIRIPHVGRLKLYEKDYIPYGEGIKYSNPRITFDGIDWFVSVAVKQPDKIVDLTPEVIGIDLGLKTLAVCSNGMIIENISKSTSYKKLNKSKLRKQRAISRKYEHNKDGNKFIKTRNIEKLQRRLRKVQIKLNDIKKDFFHKNTTIIARTKPDTIVLEDLNIKGMMKNRHLSQAFQNSSLSMFRSMLVNKCTEYGIKVVEANRFFPSSKLCSNCGSKKENLKLSERTYKCDHCLVELDRDYNASLNLKQYPEIQGNLSLSRVKESQVENLGSQKRAR